MTDSNSSMNKIEPGGIYAGKGVNHRTVIEIEKYRGFRRVTSRIRHDLGCTFHDEHGEVRTIKLGAFAEWARCRLNP